MELVPLSAGLNPPYGMVNFIELHLTAQVENIFAQVEHKLVYKILKKNRNEDFLTHCPYPLYN